jgi:heat shock protein HslJ
VRRGAVAALAAGLLALSACGSGDPATDPDSLQDVTWVADAASLGSLVPGLPDPARADIRFTDGEVSGHSGCNLYGGTYAAKGDGSLTIEVGAMTEMACDEPLMALDAAFTAALSEVTGFQVTGNGLLLTGGAVALTFAREASVPPLPLIGTTWTLDTIGGDGGTVSSVIAGTTVTIRFADDGSFGGSSGCNSYGGRYTREGDALHLRDIAATAMACEGPAGVMEQEGAVLDLLGRTASFTIVGAQLTLSDAGGALLLGFTGAAA